MREQVVRDEFRGLKSKFATLVATVSHGVPRSSQQIELSYMRRIRANTSTDMLTRIS